MVLLGAYRDLWVNISLAVLMVVTYFWYRAQDPTANTSLQREFVPARTSGLCFSSVCEMYLDWTLFPYFYQVGPGQPAAVEDQLYGHHLNFLVCHSTFLFQLIYAWGLTAQSQQEEASGSWHCGGWFMDASSAEVAQGSFVSNFNTVSYFPWLIYKELEKYTACLGQGILLSCCHVRIWFFMGVHANDFQEQQGAEKAKDLHEEVQAYGCVCVTCHLANVVSISKTWKQFELSNCIVCIGDETSLWSQRLKVSLSNSRLLSMSLPCLPGAHGRLDGWCWCYWGPVLHSQAMILRTQTIHQSMLRGSYLGP